MPIGNLVKKYNLEGKFEEILIKIFKVLNNIKIQIVDEAFSMYFDKLNNINEKEHFN